MRTITTLATSRIKYNKSRTLLTFIAIMLTTVLLMGLGTCVLGLLDYNRQQAVAEGNTHASFYNLTKKQVDILKNHMDIEALEINETFASVEYEKMNGYLGYGELLKGDIYHRVGNIIEGHEAVLADEICGPKAFFERMGVEPVIGNKITISFRPHGEGSVETREFTICGLMSQLDISNLDISDSRIAYSASISGALAEEYFAQEERYYMANIRVAGESEMNYDEIEEVINSVAADIGCETNNIRLNQAYLYAMTDTGAEAKQIGCAIGALIVIFSGLVIYSIYYVCVITDVQEIGKLKALGASKRQIKRLLLSEGMRIALYAVPVGLLLGYLIPYIVLPIVFRAAIAESIIAAEIEKVHMFSLPLLFGVVIVILFVICLSLLKPMRMAGKISPVEAIRYQESSTFAKIRQGNKNVSLLRLGLANLVRNKKRTLVTIIAMGLSCVLFVTLASVLGSMRAEDIARRSVEMGDFRLKLDYSLNDKVYPENNLDSLQKRNLFGDELLERIGNIDGVERIEGRTEQVLVSSEYPSELFEDGYRITISYMDRELAKEYQKEVVRGVVDYDAMVAEGGAVYTSEGSFEKYGFAIGDIVPFTVYDGSRQIPFSVKIVATVQDGSAPYFMIPKEVWDELDLEYDATTDLFISVDKERYEAVKASLQEIADEEPYFLLYSIDEEMELGKMSVAIVKYPLYAILAIIAVISFMNLINTMVTSIVTRKHELGVLQAIGLSDKQLTKMLAGEGMVFVAGTLAASLTLGNLFGYLAFAWAKENAFMSLKVYHYPLVETFLLTVVLIAGQLGITCFIAKRIHKESLIDRIRSGE